jgi:hypothetical protein
MTKCSECGGIILGGAGYTHGSGLTDPETGYRDEELLCLDCHADRIGIDYYDME